MFLEHFRITASAMAQIFLLAAIGYFLVRRKIIGSEGLAAFSRLVIEVTLPLLIFTKLAAGFSFRLYPRWWIFPLLSILITCAGLITGALFMGPLKGQDQRRQFLGLVSFQNSGFLPMALIAALFTRAEADVMFIYLFLFLTGFNLIIWSLGVHILSYHKKKKFELGSLFSPPVLATLFSLVFIFLGLNRMLPAAIYKPLKTVGDCTVPIALLVVGGNLAQIHLGRIDKKAIALLLLAKMIVMPALGFLLVTRLNLPVLIGLLVIMQLAMPSATSLSVIVRHYKREDLLISQGVFFSHLLGIITIPLFLSLYFALSMIK
ncbi:MAG: AEC family transporter [Candidatus Omnitrophica bacterium]|nr:AEC family transporter [Candidatus Omnitrophota bacterium]